MLGRDDVHQGELLRHGTARPALTGTGRAPGAAPLDAEQGAGPAARPGARRRRRAWLGACVVLALGALLILNWSSALSAARRPASALAPELRRALDHLRGPVRIGLQVGHLHESSMPRELVKLRAATGAEVGGLEEVNINRAIVRALAARLRADGFRVDVLGATIPPGYRATLVLAVHADASRDPAREGYKSAHFLPLRNARDPLLKLDVDRAVLTQTSLGDDDRNVSLDMLKYYAFNGRRFRHSVARGTPALIVEMGYMTNARDRTLLLEPASLARALEAGIISYLHDIQRIPPGPPGQALATARP